MKQLYARLSENGRVVFFAIVVAICGFLLSFPLCFFNYWDVPLGWLFGCSLGILSFLVLNKEMDVVVGHQSKWVFILFYLLRFALYLFGLVVAFILMFNGIKVINPYAVFAGYIPIKVIIVCLFGK